MSNVQGFVVNVRSTCGGCHDSETIEETFVVATMAVAGHLISILDNDERNIYQITLTSFHSAQEMRRLLQFCAAHYLRLFSGGDVVDGIDRAKESLKQYLWLKEIRKNIKDSDDLIAEMKAHEEDNDENDAEDYEDYDE